MSEPSQNILRNLLKRRQYNKIMVYVYLHWKTAAQYISWVVVLFQSINQSINLFSRVITKSPDQKFEDCQPIERAGFRKACNRVWCNSRFVQFAFGPISGSSSSQFVQFTELVQMLLKLKIISLFRFWMPCAPGKRTKAFEK